MSVEDRLDRLIATLERTVGRGNLGAGVERMAQSFEKLDKTEQERIVQEQRFKKAEADMYKSSSRILGNFNSRLSKYSKDVVLQTQLMANAFEKGIENLSYDEFEAFPKQFQQYLNQTESFKKLVFNTAADALKFNSQLAQRAEIIETMNKLDTASGEEQAELKKKLSKLAQAEGMSMRQLYIQRKKLTRQVQEGTEAQAQMNRQMNDGALGEMMDRAGAVREAFQKLIPAMAVASAAFVQAAAPPLKFGTRVADSLDAFMAGMSPEEMAQNMAEYRLAINASGMSMQEFRDITEDGALTLTAYTGDLRDAVRVQSSAFDAAQQFGVQGQENMKQFMDTQVSAFKKFNSVFSMTAEEFVQMNEQIKNSQSIGEQMYRLNRRQRAQHVQEIQQTVMRLKTFGLMQDQAMKVVDAMAAIGAKSPKERMKEAAKMQAVGGALGFGSAATEMADIMRRGMRGEGDMERYAQLQQEAQAKVGEKMGAGLASELMTSQLLETAGMEEYLGPKSQFADLNKQQFKQTQDMAKADVDRNVLLGQILGAINMVEQALLGPVVKGLGAIVAALGGLAVLKKIASLLGARNAAGAAGGMGGAKGLMGKAGLLGGAAWAGWEIGTAINDSMEKHLPWLYDDVVDKVGGGIAKIVGIFDDDVASLISSNEERDKKRLAKAVEQREKSMNADRITDAIAALERAKQHHIDEGNQKIVETLEAQIKIQEEQLEKLEEVKDEAAGTSKAVNTTTKRVEEQTQQQKEIAEDGKKQSKVIWGRAPALSH